MLRRRCRPIQPRCRELCPSADRFGKDAFGYADARDGQYKLLDFNARTWGYHSLGSRAGVDFPYLLFADQIGETPYPCRAPAGVRWMRSITDLPTAMLAMSQGRLDVKAYLRSLNPVHTEAVFTRDDLLPWFAEFALLPYLALKR